VDQAKLQPDEIFCAAIELAAPAERAAYLDQACGDDRETRRRVERLLEAHSQAGSFLVARPALEPATTDLPAESSGTAIGPYKLLQEIGTGGMGVVWMAEQTRPVQRKVALKIIKAGMDSRQVLARFEAERQALALMDHPNIAKVLDAGATAAGGPFFVMELVKGQSITQYCDEQRLTPPQRLELFVSVCQAIQHAHQKGIIHRDIKPSNVLVAPYDGNPVVKVIDFGVAKATGQRLTEKTLFTELGAVVGTLEYMSPEQAELNNQDIDTRSDIYALGVLLYELLTGSTPLTRQQLKQADFGEILRLIREEEPPRPSTRLSDSGETLASISAQRHMEPAKLTKLVRGELDWIVMKCLEKDRNRRYETAGAFAQDVQRYLNDEPVLACPPSAWYRFRKFTRRNKGRLTLAASFFLLFVVLAGGIGWNLQEHAQRASKTAYGVEQVLGEVARLQKENKWAEALAALNRAEGLLAGGHGSADLQQRLHQVRAVIAERLREAQEARKMSADLAEILLRQTEVKDGHFDWQRSDDEYAEAFRQYGIEVDKLTVAEAAAWIGAREIAPELVAALDFWAELRRRQKPDEAGWKHLLAVARVADADKVRNQLRDAVEKRDRQALLTQATAPTVGSLPPSTLVLLGNALLTSGAVKEAVVLFRRAQLVHPGDFWINHQLAAALMKLQPPQHQQAVGYYRAALAVRESPGVYLNLGKCLLHCGADDEAIAAFEQAIRLKGDYAEAYYNRGLALGLKDRRDDAIASYKEAVRLKPNFVRAHYWLGTELRKKGRLDEALAELNEAIRLKPDYAEAHRELGVTYWYKNRPEEATAAFQKAVHFKPDFAEAHRDLGLVLRKNGQSQEAIDAFKAAIRHKPDYADAYINLGTELGKKGRLAEAVAALDEAIRIVPGSVPAWTNRGTAHQALRQWDKALADFEKARELSQGDPIVLDKVTRLLVFCPDLKLRDPARAVQLATQAVQKAPKVAACWRTLGVAHYRTGKWRDAAADLEKSMALRNGGNAFEWFFLAMCHWHLGDKDKARGWYDKAVMWMEKHRPNYDWLREDRAEAAELLGVNKEM
jgi:serine/threonine protein kinase/Tfp pilus assembly protein PilF